MLKYDIVMWISMNYVKGKFKNEKLSFVNIYIISEIPFKPTRNYYYRDMNTAKTSQSRYYLKRTPLSKANLILSQTNSSNFRPTVIYSN